MNNERQIKAFKNYFLDFMQGLSDDAQKKIYYVLDMLKVEARLSTKFVKSIRDGLFELRVGYEGNIYRVFFIFDEDKIIILFNGFNKKTQKTPVSEINKALSLKKEYYESKRQLDQHR